MGLRRAVADRRPQALQSCCTSAYHTWFYRWGVPDCPRRTVLWRAVQVQTGRAKRLQKPRAPSGEDLVGVLKHVGPGKAVLLNELGTHLSQGGLGLGATGGCAGGKCREG